jgi:hypothetical protein
MLLTRTASLTFAAACLTAIAAMPIHAQTAGTYGTAPGYRGAPAAYSSTPGYDRPRGDASQASQGDAAQSASARRNVAESHQYDRALETNRGFRQARMRKESGPISDLELRQSCLASFQQDEPSMGSSGSSRAQRSASGR